MQELLAKRSNWTQGREARTVDDKPCRVNSSKAYKFCLLGALIKCYGSNFMDIPAYNLLSRKTGGISSWNDNPDRTFGDVRRLIEELDI